MATVLVTGGTGLIGKALTRLLLNKNYSVIVLTRNPQKYTSDHLNLTYARWDVAKKEIDPAALQKADIIIHLAGENVAAKRWTDRRKEEILKSRTETSALLVESLSKLPHHVHTFVSSSAIGWYGPDPVKNAAEFTGFVESDPASDDFLGDTCLAWERSVEPVIDLDIRLVKVRTGIVLSNDGGAFASFKQPLTFGVAAILGSGDQVLSWIHIEDLCRIYLQAIENTGMRGAYNAVAPNLLTNKEFTLQLAKQLKGKSFITMHVPEWVLKTMLGELSVEILKSCSVNDTKLRQSGFKFIYPTAEAAIAQLVKR
jgi:uncharacterized protein